MNHSTSSFLKRALTLALVAAPALAQAHPGHGGHSLLSGMEHPLMGMDHLLAMVAVGLWAAQLGGRATWMVPAAFVGVMSLGGALAMNGFVLPGIEQGILASVLILGVLVAASVRLPALAGAALVALFAFCHGQAHGAEMPAAASSLSYALGFASSTAMIHAAGLGFGLAARQSAALRLSGAAIATSAILLALGLL